MYRIAYTLKMVLIVSVISALYLLSWKTYPRDLDAWKNHPDVIFSNPDDIGSLLSDSLRFETTNLSAKIGAQAIVFNEDFHGDKLSKSKIFEGTGNNFIIVKKRDTLEIVDWKVSSGLLPKNYQSYETALIDDLEASFRKFHPTDDELIALKTHYSLQELRRMLSYANFISLIRQLGIEHQLRSTMASEKESALWNFTDWGYGYEWWKFFERAYEQKHQWSIVWYLWKWFSSAAALLFAMLCYLIMILLFEKSPKNLFIQVSGDWRRVDKEKIYKEVMGSYPWNLVFFRPKDSVIMGIFQQAYYDERKRQEIEREKIQQACMLVSSSNPPSASVRNNHTTPIGNTKQPTGEREQLISRVMDIFEKIDDAKIEKSNIEKLPKKGLRRILECVELIGLNTTRLLFLLPPAQFNGWVVRSDSTFSKSLESKDKNQLNNLILSSVQ